MLKFPHLPVILVQDTRLQTAAGSGDADKVQNDAGQNLLVCGNWRYGLERLYPAFMCSAG